MKTFLSTIQRLALPSRRFSSAHYWDDRYRAGGNSGPGSYGNLATFKAEVLNRFVQDQAITSVIEFGCGDGHQLSLARYPRYTGYDVSGTAVTTCCTLFSKDVSKEFYLTGDYDGRRADLALSLDVIFHLTEDDIFDAYMRRLFGASDRFVAIYSSDQDEAIQPVATHVRHRRFSAWIEFELRDGRCWRLLERIKNPYPYNGDSRSTSFSDFYFFVAQR